MASDNPKLPKPDWSLWAFIVDASVGDTVVLSCDIDPEEHSIYDLPQGPLFEEARRRDRIIRNLLDNSKLQYKNRFKDKRWIRHVLLAPFGTWAENAGWDIPAQFPRLPRAPEPPKTPPPIEPEPTPVATAAPATIEVPEGKPPPVTEPKPKPLGNRERGSLITVIAAFAKKDGIDISQRGKAGDAIEMLVKEQLGKKVSSRAIQNYLKNAEDLIARRNDDPGDE